MVHPDITLNHLYFVMADEFDQVKDLVVPLGLAFHRVHSEFVEGLYFMCTDGSYFELLRYHSDKDRIKQLTDLRYTGLACEVAPCSEIDYRNLPELIPDTELKFKEVKAEIDGVEEHFYDIFNIVRDEPSRYFTTWFHYDIELDDVIRENTMSSQLLSLSQFTIIGNKEFENELRYFTAWTDYETSSDNSEIQIQIRTRGDTIFSFNTEIDETIQMNIPKEIIFEKDENQHIGNHNNQVIKIEDLGSVLVMKFYP